MAHYPGGIEPPSDAVPTARGGKLWYPSTVRAVLRSVALDEVATVGAQKSPGKKSHEGDNQLIEEYNAGSINVEEFFRRLMEFAKGLNAEEQRTIAENLSEEELAVFDLMTKPEVDLTDEDRALVKEVAQELLATLKEEKLVIDWRKKQESRARVRLTIEENLDRLPEAFSMDAYRQKVDRVYQHVYDSYFGEGRSVYGVVAA